MSTLILKSANKSRPSGQWDANDFDVFDGECHIGRIMWTHAASGATPWFWSIFRGHGPQAPTDKGYATTREEAMAALKLAWSSSDIEKSPGSKAGAKV
jgi:hypothetical protein